MNARRHNSEWTRLYYRPDLRGIESLHAHFVLHRYARHAHEHLVIGLVEDGVQSYVYRGARHVTVPGEVFLVNPGEAHTGEPATPRGYIYRTLCVGVNSLAQISRECTRNRGVPSFREAVIRDRPLASLLSRFHRALACGSGKLECESLLLSSLTDLFVRHADEHFVGVAARSERPAVRMAREYLESQYSTDVSLSELASVVRLSPHHLARVFQREVGLPPHAYLEQVRLRHACALLQAGHSIVRAALTVGYPDQSHFTRRFKRVFGVTPGRYLRERVATKTTPLDPGDPAEPAHTSGLLPSRRPAASRSRGY